MIRALATAGLGSVETALVKATFDDDERSKGKHFRTLIDWVNLEMINHAQTRGATYNTSKNIDIIALFNKRIHVGCWKVVLKTLVLIHTLMRDADSIFMEEFCRGYGQSYSNSNDHIYSGSLQSNAKILIPMHIFVDRHANDGIVQSTFIRKYSKYLSTKVDTFVELGFNIERKLDPRNKNFFANNPASYLGKALPKMLKQLSALIECLPTLSTTLMVNDIAKDAMLLLIKDSLRLYPGVQLCLWEMICTFQKLSLDQAQWTARTFNRYFEVNKQFRNWFDSCIRLGIIDYSFLPKFDVLKESLLVKLNEFIRSKENEKRRNKRKKNRRSNDDDDEDDDTTSESGDDSVYDSNEGGSKENETTADKEKKVSIAVGNLEDVLDEAQLQNFSAQLKAFRKSQPSTSPREVPKKIRTNYKGKFSTPNRSTEPSEADEKACGTVPPTADDDFLGVVDLFSSAQSPEQGGNMFGDGAIFAQTDDWLKSLDIGTAPTDAISTAAVQWSNEPQSNTPIIQSQSATQIPQIFAQTNDNPTLTDLSTDDWFAQQTTNAAATVPSLAQQFSSFPPNATQPSIQTQPTQQQPQSQPPTSTVSSFHFISSGTTANDNPTAATATVQSSFAFMNANNTATVVASEVDPMGPPSTGFIANSNANIFGVNTQSQSDMYGSFVGAQSQAQIGDKSDTMRSLSGNEAKHLKTKSGNLADGGMFDDLMTFDNWQS